MLRVAPDALESEPLPGERQCEQPLPGSRWRGLGGELVRVCCVATRDEDGRQVVVYQSLADGTVRSADLCRWTQAITQKGGSQRPRFERVEQEGGDDA